MQLILLAAGRGSRLDEKYRNKPKCLAKINTKSILDHNLEFYNLFNKKMIITGYKKKDLKNFSKQNKFKVIHNKKYRTTNMTYSLFLAKKYITQDIIVCYGDIIFDKKIYKLLREKKNIIPVNKNWYKLWQKRMPTKEIKNDAENLTIKKNLIKSIGGKIKNRLPKYQYMGIFKIKKKDFFLMEKFFRKINNNKLDLTNFLDLTIKNINLNFKVLIYRSFWFEIDTSKDIKVASKNLE